LTGRTANSGRPNLEGNQDKEKRDFVATYGHRADDDEIHGIRRFEVARLICPMRLTVSTSSVRKEFDVTFVENWSRLNYSTRAKAHKFGSLANYTTGRGLSIIDVDTIFRPIHLTPTWEDADLSMMYLNSQTDVHAWMNFY
jgi:hypothetical protein